MDFARGVQKALDDRGVPEVDWYRRAQDRDIWRKEVVYGITEVFKKRGKQISREDAYVAREKQSTKPKSKNTNFYQSETTGEWGCPACERSFKTKRGVAYHYGQKHGERARALEEGEKFKCELCNAEFGSKNWLTVHIKEIHELDPEERTCKICRKFCKSRRDLNYHVKMKHPVPEQQHWRGHRDVY